MLRGSLTYMLTHVHSTYKHTYIHTHTHERVLKYVCAVSPAVLRVYAQSHDTYTQKEPISMSTCTEFSQ